MVQWDKQKKIIIKTVKTITLSHLSVLFYIKCKLTQNFLQFYGLYSIKAFEKSKSADSLSIFSRKQNLVMKQEIRDKSWQKNWRSVTQMAVTSKF